ncbi:MAG: hypothetical protein ACHP7A_01910 [Caulobacterales bacterium]
MAGLNAKREELIRLRDKLEADLRAVTCDIDHLEGAIRLFDPEATPEAVRRYTTRHRAKKGSVRRFVLAALRDTEEPVTSRDLTEWWCEERGLRTDDATFVIIRCRIGASLTALQAQGAVRGAGMVGSYKGWVRA